VPNAPHAQALSGVDEEIRSLIELLPGAVVLNGADATHDTVMRALPAHAIAHFACHSVSDVIDPGASYLLLHDHDSQPLTVREMSQSQLIDGELAYLSACSTTDTSLRLADEAVHMTAAFQLAGYHHVIGTFWPVNDEAATRVAVEVFCRLTSQGRHSPTSEFAAEALHIAIRRVRTDHLLIPTRWAAHLHMGA
jgi:CHAT domain-containing protein